MMFQTHHKDMFAFTFRMQTRHILHCVIVSANSNFPILLEPNPPLTLDWHST